MSCLFDNEIYVLNFILTFNPRPLCWRYSARSQKSHFSSAHTKSVKRGLALSILRNSFLRSCFHETHSSFQCQVDHLQNCAYLSILLYSASRALLKEIHKSRPVPETTNILKRASIPYIRCLSHRLKKTGKRAGCLSGTEPPRGPLLQRKLSASWTKHHEAP